MALARNGDYEGKASAAHALATLAAANASPMAAVAPLIAAIIASAGGIEALVALACEGNAYGKARAASSLASLVAVNESVRSMPSMTLLQNRLGRVHELQTEAIHGPCSGHHICSNIDAQYCHPDGSRSTWR